MIEMLLEDTPEGHYWVVTCDVCGVYQTYRTSEDIKGWQFKKATITLREKHFCSSCK